MNKKPFKLKGHAFIIRRSPLSALLSLPCFRQGRLML
jgi:hypothetical protein